jgi:hypothetical protein
MGVWASLSEKVCETILMKKMRPSLLIIPVGINISMPRARSGVRQFLSFVLSDYSLETCADCS